MYLLRRNILTILGHRTFHVLRPVQYKILFHIKHDPRPEVAGKAEL